MIATWMMAGDPGYVSGEREECAMGSGHADQVCEGAVDGGAWLCSALLSFSRERGVASW
jgi:hypothetical protein